MPRRVTDPASQRHWTRWYSLQIWRKRRDYQLRTEPLCRECLKLGLVVPAAIVDHIRHHQGDWAAFRLGELQSLCEPCHAHKGSDGKVKPYARYSSEIGDDGLPLAADHPFNRPRPSHKVP
jgi:5-methylcytosine-specific restriction endonuclease McrA